MRKIWIWICKKYVSYFFEMYTARQADFYAETHNGLF